MRGDKKDENLHLVSVFVINLAFSSNLSLLGRLRHIDRRCGDRSAAIHNDRHGQRRPRRHAPDYLLVSAPVR